ncbi:MAG: pyridoxamine 5'-phosphate oxidase family protein [Lachnospiraceae bacterium]|nr:pyridoxamine 5'-phosphate oxidase family protein [Lachnospiraceae bacterium]
MFRDMRRIGQKLPEDRCREILEKAPRGVLSLLGDGGYPYGIPVDFFFEGDTLYFHCAKEGHKIDAVKACDKASFCVMENGGQEEGDWWYHFESVIVFGRISLVEEEAEKTRVLRLIGNKYMPSEEMVEAVLQRSGARAAVLALRIEHMSGKRVNEK